jgi:hypothetical protein
MLTEEQRLRVALRVAAYNLWACGGGGTLRSMWPGESIEGVERRIMTWADEALTRGADSPGLVPAIAEVVRTVAEEQ